MPDFRASVQAFLNGRLRGSGEFDEKAPQMPSKLEPGSTVLIVEDDPDAQKHLVSVLDRAGYIAIPSHTGETALRVIEAHGEIVDAVITSLLLPGLASGWDVGRAFQVRNRSGVVVYGSVEMFEQSQAADRIGFVSRPYDPAMILATLRSFSTEPNVRRKTTYQVA